MADNISALSHEIDKEKIAKVVERVDLLSREVTEIVDKIVSEACSDLDDYMQGIDEILTNQKNPVTDAQLDDFAFNLSSILYFVAEAQENLGIKEDVSRAVQKEN